MSPNDNISRNTPTRAVRLSSGDPSLESAESIYDDMKIDRPHMAARLSKLMPKASDDGREWSLDIKKDKVHVWALKAYPGSSARFVAIIWFELVGPKNRKDNASTASSSSSSSGSSSDGTDGTTAHIEVRYPNISKWTAFTSRDMKKDAGVHKFWKKNGFIQESLEVGNVNQDGFFVRNAGIHTSKRRRVPTQIFTIPDVESVVNSSRKRKDI
jgi:hypothetical protein